MTTPNVQELNYVAPLLQDSIIRSLLDKSRGGDLFYALPYVTKVIEAIYNKIPIINMSLHNKVTQLYKTNFDTTASTVNPFYPYTVLNMEGVALYRVSNHQGVFGNSRLDLELFAYSHEVEFYYLMYKDLTNRDIISLLLVDKLEEVEIDRASILTSYDTSRTIVSTDSKIDLNYISASSSTNNRYTYETITAYRLETPFLRVLGSSDILNNKAMFNTDMYLSSNGYETLELKTSQWILFRKQDRSIRLNNLQGLGVERVIEIPSGEDYLYYFVLREPNNIINYIESSFNIELQTDFRIIIKGELIDA
jgi:hypothetical protein